MSEVIQYFDGQHNVAKTTAVRAFKRSAREREFKRRERFGGATLPSARPSALCTVILMHKKWLYECFKMYLKDKHIGLAKKVLVLEIEVY